MESCSHSMRKVVCDGVCHRDIIIVAERFGD